MIPRGPNRWLALFVTARLLATAVACTLLLAHTVTDHDAVLIWIGGGYGAVSALAAWGWRRLQHAPLVWTLDVAATLALVVASEEWRSPFYLMALSSLVFPAVSSRLRQAFVIGVAFMLAYLGVAIATGVDVAELRSTTRLESLSTHLLMPILVALALARAGELLAERERSARLEIEAERRRIALELHDSAKQRVHAAHLVLSSLRRGLDGEPAAAGVDQAMSELRAATADMETSLRELRTPLEGRGLQDAVRRRADELASAGGVPIEVRGHVPELPTFVAAHAFRVAGEAMTNAVRHAHAGRVVVELAGDEDHLRVVVSDDGRGLPERPRPGSHGLRSMAARAETLGGSFSVEPGPGGCGTVVRLDVPLGADGHPT
ncbi:MAG: sensor histidine kinase [Thermoleophilaceae bacterium]